MARIDYKVSVTPVEVVGDNSDGTGMAAETISANIRRTLGGQDSNVTWQGSDTAAWSAGVPTTVTSGGGSIASSSSDGIWIKHTGFDFDAAQADNVGTTVNTATLTITTGTAITLTLEPGSAIFLPNPSNETWSFTDDGTPCAVEVADFT